ncbi:MAG: MFS transporter [Bacteroidales bacterium]|nr:MFS transporter [Bacteroidales bacterium]
MSKAKNFQTANVLTTSIAHFFHDVYTSFLAPLLPILIDKLGINLFQAGLLSVFQRLPTLFNPFIGILAERAKARYFIIFTPAITAMSMSLIGVAPHYTLLVIIMLVSGLSSAFFHVPGPVMIRKVSGDRPGMGMSFFMVGGEIARTVGPIAIIGAYSLWGLEGTWRLMPVGIIASIVLFYRLKDIEIRKDFSIDEKRTNYLKVIKRLAPMYISLTGFTFMFGAIKSSLSLYLPTYISGQGFSFWLAGASLAILHAAGVAGTLLSGTLADRYGNRRLLRVVSVATPLLMLLFTQVNAFWGIPVLILLGLFLYAPNPILLTVVNSTVTEHKTFINGVYFTINFLLNAIMVMVVGWIADRIGLETTYKLSVIGGFLAIPFIWSMKKSIYSEF